MRKVIYSIITLCILFFGLHTPVAKAQLESLFDDFSSDLSQWQFIRDDGRYWSLVDGALEAYIPFGSTVTELVPTSAAWYFETKNYVFEFDFTALQGADKNISFGIIDTNNWYEIHFTPSFTELVRVKNGAVVWRKEHSYVLNTGVTYHPYITFMNGRVILFINDVLIFDFTDPTFENNYGKVGIKATTGGIFPTKIRIDNFSVTNIPTEAEQEKKLPVTLLKQTDPKWVNTEYDTAAHWATALQTGISFKEWACNLIAQTMLLKYHNITELPDRSSLNPVSLNTWFIENKGYYNSPHTGNINPHSISTLSKLVSNKLNTPKLEYSYVKNNWLTTAVTEIKKGNPVIVELQGHFVVAYGYTSDKKDLYIHDPAYSYTKLSQHRLPVKSVRLYTPTHTDLSYISIVSDQPINATLTTENSEHIAMHNYEESVAAFTGQQDIAGPVTYVHELAQPSSANYNLSLTAEKPTQILLTTYRSDGTAQELLSETLSKGKTSLNLEYYKDKKSKISQQKETKITYQDFKKTIKQLSVTGAIKQKYFEKVLIQLLKPVESFSIKNQKKLLRVVKIIVSTAPQSIITNPAQSLLLDQVKLLMANLKNN